VKYAGKPPLLWGQREDFKTAVREGWIPIFENFDPKALGMDKQLEKQN